MPSPAIKVENLSKRYRIGERTGYKTIREALTNLVKAPIKNVSGKGRSANSRTQSETIWALKDVSFEVQPGEIVGIIGRNGAGKSTLLKVLAKITEPTDGRVEIRGRVGSLLEIGTGFHPELTGHENIYLYGAILGMDRWEVTRKFDEIVAFAEMEKFIETPVKRYSSGMYMRLAFAVAAHMETEILLVDEVLAVGDAEFQRKCLGKMDDVAKQGRTVLFVSHNMQAIRSLCTAGLLIQTGGIRAEGAIVDVIAVYEMHITTDIKTVWINPNLDKDDDIAAIGKIEVLNSEFNQQFAFLSSDDVIISFIVHIKKEDPGLKFGFDLIRNGEVVFRSQQVDSPNPLKPLTKGEHQVFCCIPANLLNVGEYHIIPLLSIHLFKGLIRDLKPAVKFSVQLNPSASAFHMVLNERNHPGSVFPLLEWGHV